MGSKNKTSGSKNNNKGKKALDAEQQKSKKRKKAKTTTTAVSRGEKLGNTTAVPSSAQQQQQQQQQTSNAGRQQKSKSQNSKSTTYLSVAPTVVPSSASEKERCSSNTTVKQSLSEQEKINIIPWEDRVVRVFCAVCLAVAVIFSFSTLTSCNFVKYEAGEVPFMSHIPHIASNVTNATLGMTRFNPNNAGCRPYGDDGTTTTSLHLDSYFLAARFAAYMAAFAGFSSLVLVLTEFICCRFTCSRSSVIGLSVVAVITQPLTFLAYASTYCVERIGTAYRCSYDAGSTLSIIAWILYIAAGVACCTARRSKPAIRQLLEMERDDDENSDNRTCCYCFGKKEKDDEGNENDHFDSARDEEEEEPAAAAAASSAASRWYVFWKRETKDDDRQQQQEEEEIENRTIEKEQVPWYLFWRRESRDHKEQQEETDDDDQEDKSEPWYVFWKKGKKKKDNETNNENDDVETGERPRYLFWKRRGGKEENKEQLHRPSVEDEGFSSAKTYPSEVITCAPVSTKKNKERMSTTSYRKKVVFENAEVIEEDLFFDTKTL